ncbi:hypothetical protein V6N13_134210 [Hibiscus sabdariffa]|uniref:Uncharacterized protein n=1 Tax=Hibiscus sabdariffa TaxID=183260 RepID=A0ABR2R362_9ROSI
MTALSDCFGLSIRSGLQFLDSEECILDWVAMSAWDILGFIGEEANTLVICLEGLLHQAALPLCSFSLSPLQVALPSTGTRKWFSLNYGCDFLERSRPWK